MKPLKVLILKNKAIGDSIISFGSIAYLQEQCPHWDIVYALPSWIRPLYDHIDLKDLRLLPLEFKKASDWIQSFKILNNEDFDYIIELNQSGRSKSFFSWPGKLLKAKYFYHNHHLKHGSFIMDQGVLKPHLQREIDGVYSVLKRITKAAPGHYLNYRPELTLKQPVSFDGSICFGVVASRDDKRWPIKSFIDLARELLKRYSSKKILIPLSSAEIDRKLKHQLEQANLGPGLVIIEKNLAHLPLWVAKAKLYIGNDTGLKHLAVSLGLKSMTFFGPENPLEWNPYHKLEHHSFYPPSGLISDTSVDQVLELIQAKKIL